MSGNVVGPAASVGNTIPVFDGTTGKILKDTSAVVTAAGDLIVSGIVFSTNIPTGSLVGDMQGPGGSTDSCIPRFDGTSGKVLKSSSATLDGAGNLSVPGIITAANIPAGSSMGDVTGPMASSDNALARFDGSTGKVLQASTAQLSDDGNLTIPGALTAASISAGNIPTTFGNVSGPASAVLRSLPVFGDVTGKTLGVSATTVTTAGALMLAGGSTCTPAVPTPSPTPFGYYEMFSAPAVLFTGPWSGTVTASLTAVRIGDRLIMLTIGGIANGAIVATSLIESTTLLPSNFCPGQTAKATIPVLQNGAFVAGLLFITSGGKIQIGPSLSFSGASPSPFVGVLGLTCGSMGATSILYSA